MLPGFDATRHAIGEPDLLLQNERVVGKAPVVGTHLLADESWIASGVYRVEIDPSGERPRIISLTLIVEK